ncbi:MAG: DUF805 domain-containing protein [Eubacterium sp.]|nr:DUF805 domain-containing protein [Eubacterium sp.]MCM1302951.1 DUF805 domain-containing protein [Butyrivibrio sp.]MCM1343023.1 DUF805 domain-containing protein [Muribaculaceae bacterium]MCM1410754.1 DUF805 domain-containing protein [Lachnospiraceae bacterium]
MKFMEAVEHVFSHYAVFEGRARRSEFWYFQLFYYLVLTALATLAFTGIAALLIPVFMVGALVPNLAVCWRRFHDIGKSGLWYLIIFVPLVGVILMIVWLSQDGQPGNNQYGPNPKDPGRYSAPPGQGVSSLPGRGCLAVQCLSGPLQGQIYPIRDGEILFGRESVCAVRMPEGTPGISRRHCCIRWQQGMPMLIDLSSSYGTFLADGKKLPPHYPEPVAAGTRFYLGNRGNLFQIIVYS